MYQPAKAQELQSMITRYQLVLVIYLILGQTKLVFSVLMDMKGIDRLHNSYSGR